LNFNQYNFEKISKNITKEKIQQDTKFGVTRKLTPTECLPILVEEIEDYAIVICEHMSI
jgi:hypothetical protein